ncbi:MAG: hypothetical protein LBF92_09570, partial [Synergistaceae bacterium]|nr:hypothetical protein [Synergistaceae bacterium]
MKINTKIVVVLTIFVEFIASYAFSETLELSKLDLSKEPKNFRGLEWGQRIPWGKRLFEFYSVKGDGEKTYRRRKEKLY